VLNAADATTKGTVTQNDAVFSVDSYDIAPDGNCLEATFRLAPKALSFSIAPRDVVIIETRPDSSSSWAARYRGYIALAGNPRSDNVETYRLVGLKQRFYEIVLRSGPQGIIVESNDVATMASGIFTAPQFDLLSPGITGVSIGSFESPLLSFTSGDRITQLETVGSALDALAGLVGKFVVPTGSTYTYDSVVYTAGMVVPAVTWGVRANGIPFFRRPVQNVGAISETDIDVDITYPALSAEEVIDSPILVYYPGMDISRAVRFQSRNGTTQVVTPLLPVFQPWSYRKQTPNPSMQVVQLPNPNDYLSNALSEYNITGNTLGSPTLAYDGDDSTYATGVFPNFFAFSRSSIPYETAPTALRILVEFGDDIAVQFRSRYSYSFAGQVNQYEFWWEPIATAVAGDVTRLQVMFPVLLPVETFAFVQKNNLAFLNETHSIEIIAGPNGNGGTAKVFDFRPFRHVVGGDNTLANQLLQAYERPVVQEVSNVKLFGEGLLRTSLVVTPVSGSSITVPVERVQYSITTAEGVTTTYHAGQAFDGELVSERVVLEGLARRAVRT